MAAQYIQALLSGYSWGNYPISYSFPDSTSDYQYSYSYFRGFQAIELHLQQAVRFALEGKIGSSDPIKSYMSLTSVESFTNIDLYYAGRDGADMPVARTSWLARSMAYYPEGNSTWAGDVWLSNYITYADVGTYGHFTILHELGHALGLKHGHEADNGNSVVLPADRDSIEFSVMTYRTHIGDDGSYFDARGPATLMMYDIAALQHLYGANFNANSTDTVYSWDNYGGVYINGRAASGSYGGVIFMTIWDGGGVDTYDCSNYAHDLDIDLSPGGWSIVDPNQLADLGDGFTARANVFNALQYQDDPRSLIENAIGGSMNDRIRGNAADNILRGDGGNDILMGEDGNDTLYGGEGADTLMGGIGADVLDGGPGAYDTVDYSDAISSVAVYLYNNTASGDVASGDVIFNFENIFGGQGSDALAGNDLANVILGGRGNDSIYGYLGNDFLVGEDGNDNLYGHQGADNLRGGFGADVLDGGDGIDTVDYSDAVNSVTVYLYADTAFGDVATGDLISNFENIIGGQGGDVLAGSDVANVILGNEGSDQIYGWAGADYLDGGGGNDSLYAGSSRLGQADTLVGGAGVDTFYVLESRDVVITDFMIGPSGESIVFYADMLEDYGAVLAAATQVGNDIVIDKPNLIHVVLKETHMWSMVSSNFQFI